MIRIPVIEIEYNLKSAIGNRKSEIEMVTTDLSPQRVLQALPKSREHGVTLVRLAEALSLSQSQSARFGVFLKEFVRVGLVAAKGGRYWRKQAPAL